MDNFLGLGCAIYQPLNLNWKSFLSVGEARESTFWMMFFPYICAFNEKGHLV